LVEFFVKCFRHDFFLQNVFCSVFELPSLRNTRKRDKTKKVEEKLPLPRNAQKRTKNKSQGKKKSRMVGGWVGGLVNVRGGPSILFLAAPRLGIGLLRSKFQGPRAKGRRKKKEVTQDASITL
jgi:hypothetical protein